MTYEALIHWLGEQKTTPQTQKSKASLPVVVDMLMVLIENPEKRALVDSLVQDVIENAPVIEANDI